ncbi:MAG: DNA glycosylase [Fimbriimonadales bacterium]|nr:MAG: 8-oxoguanine DNA glycosylase [Fimbriimonadales bacterium]
MRISIPSWELDLPLCVGSGQVFRWRQEGARWLGYADTHLLIVEPTGNRWRIESPTAEQPAELFFRLFRMEADLKSVQNEIIRRDPRWAEWIDALPGLRLMRWLSAEECLFSFLCTPANNIPRITGMIERLCERYGEPIHRDGDTVHYAFPTVERLASADEATLRELGFGYRAKTLIAVARALQERGAGWLESLRTMDYWDAKQELMNLSGVGAKVADCVLLFGLDHMYAVPVDTHMWQAVGKWLMPDLAGKNPTDKTYRQVVEWFHERFGDMTGWAHQYLFTAHLLMEKR